MSDVLAVTIGDGRKDLRHDTGGSCFGEVRGLRNSVEEFAAVYQPISIVNIYLLVYSVTI